MNIKDLEYLVALAEHKHFKNAAIACNVSQPTLSGQIKKLEDDLSMKLLERTSRKVLFTASGLILVEQAKKILLEVKVLTDMARTQTRDMSGPIYIGVIPTLGPYLMPHVVPYLHSQYPDLDVFVYELQTAQLVEKLLAGKLDCAIVARAPDIKDCIERFLYIEPMLLAVNHLSHLSDKKEIQLKTLNNLELLLLEEGHCLRNDILNYCTDLNVRESSWIQASSLEMIRNMVAYNNGISLLPELSIIDATLQHPQISIIKVTDPTPTRDLIMIYRPGSPLKLRYEKLAEIIQQQIHEIIHKHLI